MDESLGEILVAEDNWALAGVLKLNLERAGFCVTLAGNGRVAWEHFQRRPFDAVLTDEQMPEMTGRELCRLVRQHPERSATPIIMLTAKGFELDRRQLREEVGIGMVLVKPFSPSELVRTVGECLAEAS